MGHKVKSARRLRGLMGGVAGLAALASLGCASGTNADETGMAGGVVPKEPLNFSVLRGWSDDSQTLVLAAFKRSCARILKLNPDDRLDTKSATGEPEIGSRPAALRVKLQSETTRRALISRVILCRYA